MEIIHSDKTRLAVLRQFYHLCMFTIYFDVQTHCIGIAQNQCLVYRFVYIHCWIGKFMKQMESDWSCFTRLHPLLITIPASPKRQDKMSSIKIICDPDQQLRRSIKGSNFYKNQCYDSNTFCKPNIHADFAWLLFQGYDSTFVEHTLL